MNKFDLCLGVENSKSMCSAVGMVIGHSVPPRCMCVKANVLQITPGSEMRDCGSRTMKTE